MSYLMEICGAVLQLLQTDSSTGRHDEASRRIFITNAPKEPGMIWKSVMKRFSGGSKTTGISSPYVNCTSGQQCHSFLGSLCGSADELQSCPTCEPSSRVQ
jgi:hypothetical protein